MKAIQPKTFSDTPFIGAPSLPQISHLEDRELVRLSQAGSECAFEQLVRRHKQHVFALVGGTLRHGQDVEDVAQQVFLKAYRGIRRFDQRAAFSTWLYKITVNECRDHFRKCRARPLVYEADLSEEQLSHLEGIACSERHDSEPSERMVAKETLDDLLRYLPEQDRQLLILRETQGFSIQELAEIFDLKANNVKIRLFRARGKVADAHRRRVRQEASAKETLAVRNPRLTQLALKSQY